MYKFNYINQLMPRSFRCCGTQRCEQLAAASDPVGDATVTGTLRQLGPRAPGPSHADPREFGLADIDAAGLAPLASLLS